MTTIEALTAEFDREAQTTRKHLERLPGDKLDWRPHEKSFTAGGLASHITELLSFAEWICNADELDFSGRGEQATADQPDEEAHLQTDRSQQSNRQCIAEGTGDDRHCK